MILKRLVPTWTILYTTTSYNPQGHHDAAEICRNAVAILPKTTANMEYVPDMRLAAESLWEMQVSIFFLIVRDL